MAVQALSDVQAWNQFMKLTQAARIRNASLTMPTQSAAANAGSKQSVRMGAQAGAGSPVVPSGYAPKQSQARVAVVGARFDAYA